jgi:hypothetical protein
LVIEPKLHDRFHKGLSHLCDLLGGGKAIAQMPTHEAGNASLAGRQKSGSNAALLNRGRIAFF